MHCASAPLPPRALARGGEGRGWGARVGTESEQPPRNPDERVPRARRLRREMTDAERKLWWHLRHLTVDNTHFRRQATIGPYFADFACHEKRLVTEVDGSGHGEADQMIADEKKTRSLRSAPLPC